MGTGKGEAGREREKVTGWGIGNNGSTIEIVTSNMKECTVLHYPLNILPVPPVYQFS